MSMQAESLEVLEEAEVPARQARAIVRAIEIEIDGAKDTLATKHDLLLLRQDVTEKFHGLEVKVETVTRELEVKLESVTRGLEVKLETATCGLEVKHENSIRGLEVKLENSIRGLEVRFEQTAHGLYGRMYAAFVTQIGILLGIAYFFVTHVKH